MQPPMPVSMWFSCFEAPFELVISCTGGPFLYQITHMLVNCFCIIILSHKYHRNAMMLFVLRGLYSSPESISSLDSGRPISGISDSCPCAAAVEIMF